MGSGERPMSAAKGNQSDAEALCQTPPSPTLKESSASVSYMGKQRPGNPQKCVGGAIQEVFTHVFALSKFSLTNFGPKWYAP